MVTAGRYLESPIYRVGGILGTPGFGGAGGTFGGTKSSGSGIAGGIFPGVGVGTIGNTLGTTLGVTPGVTLGGVIFGGGSVPLGIDGGVSTAGGMSGGPLYMETMTPLSGVKVMRIFPA